MSAGFADSLGMRLRRAYLALHRRANDELRRQFDVTANQFVVLSLLAEGEGISQQELCNRCYSDPSTTGALVRLMEGRGWVKRKADPKDNRVRRVHLTSKGRKLQKSLWSAAEGSFHRGLWSVPQDREQEALIFDVLDRIVESMQRPARPSTRGVDPYRLATVFQDDPYPYYRELRNRDPAHWSEDSDIWVLTRYSDVAAAFSNWRAWSSGQRGNLINDMPERIGRTLGTTDPPDHRFARSLVEQAFSRRTVDELGPRLEQRARELAERARDLGTFDLVSTISAPFNASVLGAMFGIPDADFMRLRRWLDDFFVREEAPAGGKSRQEEAMARLLEYLEALASERFSRPTGDLMGKMLAAEQGGLSLSRSQVVVTTMTFLTAGFESTNNLFTNLARALALHPAVFRRVRSSPELVPQTVEECLRWDSPAQGFVRCPTRDVSLYGKTIPEGAQVLLHIGSANRDERKFGKPDLFDIDRRDNRHLGFGQGIHFCIGAALARDMARAMMTALLEVSRDWDVDLGQAVRVTTPNFRGYSRLMVSI